jgi:predicted nucleic acid-binding protein
MKSQRQICVIDTSVLIDLHKGQLLGHVTRLHFRMLLPDFILVELENPTPQEVLAASIETGELSSSQITELIELRAKYQSLSLYDVSALTLARGLGAILLAGDRHLRLAARDEGVVVHGILWVLDSLVESGILATAEAAESLEAIINAGARLPEIECRKRLAQWSRE